MASFELTYLFKALSKYSHILRCWVLGFQQTNFGEMNLIPNIDQIYTAPRPQAYKNTIFSQDIPWALGYCSEAGQGFFLGMLKS